MEGEVYSAPETAARERELNALYLAGVLVVLAIVTVTFGALVVVFFWRSENAYLWQHLKIPRLLWVTTGVLAASSVVLEAARRRLRRDDQEGFYRLAAWTAGLGCVFLLGQAAAWWQVVSSKVLERDKHSWFLFLFGGLHALHILAGLAGIGYLLYRAHERVGGPRYQMTTRAYANALAVFWHYLGLLWVGLLGLLVGWRA